MNYFKLVGSAIHHLAKSFETNELAYLAVTSKPEAVIRDRLAFKLHTLLNQKTYTVAREWGKRRDNKAQVDIAIIKGNRLALVIQLKARSAVALQQPETLRREAQDDVNKGKRFKPKKCFYLLVVPLIETPWDATKPIIDEAVKYSRKWKPSLARKNGAKKIEQDAKDKVENGLIRNRWRVDGSNTGKKIVAGTVFKSRVSILYWLCEAP